MKGGIFSLSETFMKVISTAYLGVVLLAVFFAITRYNLIYMENRVDRETLVVGDSILSADCITETYGNYKVKDLLSEDKIKNEISTSHSNSITNISCLNYTKAIYIEIYNENNNIIYKIGNSSVCQTLNPCNKKDTTSYTIFPAALNNTVGFIAPVSVTIYLGGA